MESIAPGSRRRSPRAAIPKKTDAAAAREQGDPRVMAKPCFTWVAAAFHKAPRPLKGSFPQLVSFEIMARETGLEPAASGVTGRRSNQLSYSPAGAVRARGLRIGQRLNEVKQFPFIQHDPCQRPNVDFDRLRPTRKKQIDLTFAEGALFFPHASG